MEISLPHDASHLPAEIIVSPIKKKRYSINNKRERAVFMHRTSDVLGSFTDKTLTGMTDLVRRKIQERYGNVQALMAAMRRLKTGETGALN